MSFKKVVVLKIVWLIFAGIGVFESKASTTDHIYSEVALKKISQRIQKTLVESLEAQVFLEEDLSRAIQVLEKAQIKWVNSFSQYPILSAESVNRTIGMSKYLSMKGPSTEQVIITLEILFHIKRQLEGSTLFIPNARIKLFSQKFAPRLFEVSNPCSISIYPLPPTLSPTQRDEFNSQLISLLEARGHSYDSTWNTSTLWLSTKERTDGGCNGKNRNIFETSIRLINLEEQTGIDIAEGTGTSCGYSTEHKDESLKKLIKSLKTALPKCTIAFRNN